MTDYEALVERLRERRRMTRKRYGLTGETLAEERDLDEAADAIRDLRAERDALREALTDMLSGWRYIRETHGDLYGVGWDRAQEKAIAALAAQEKP
jgi:hypothetical protein